MHAVITNIFLVVPLKLFPVALGNDVITTRNGCASSWTAVNTSFNYLTTSVTDYLYRFHGVYIAITIPSYISSHLASGLPFVFF